MSPDDHSPGHTPDPTPAAPGSGLVERVIAVLSLRQGSFRSIAEAPSTWQSLIVALLGFALVGSVGTLALMLTVIYPVVALLDLVLSGYISRFVASMVLGQARAQSLPPYPNWVRAHMFTAAPLMLGVVPLVGLIAVPYQWVCKVVSFKDISGCSTGEGVVILLVTFVLPFLAGIIASVVFGVGILGLLGLGAFAS